MPGFIQEGDLVFDIGANMGRRVGSFLLLKAKVVALEPNQACVAEIEKVYKGWPVTVIPKGVGAEPGELTFLSLPIRSCRLSIKNGLPACSKKI